MIWLFTPLWAACSNSIALAFKNNYRIYSRISPGFLDNFLIKNWMGRGIKDYIFLAKYHSIAF